MKETRATRTTALVAGLMLLLPLAVGCGWKPPGRVILIGIDGATLRVAGPLLEQGRLPHLAEIAKAGVSGKLRSFKPLFSPRIWNSIATGKTPAHHGIAGFTFRDEQNVQQLFLGTHRKVHAVWNMVSDAGGTVGVVNWWNTYPPEILNGVMISDHARPERTDELRKMTGAETADPTGTPVLPIEWLQLTADAYAKPEPLTEVADPFDGNALLPEWTRPQKLSQRYDEDGATVRIALEIEKAAHPDLMLVFLPGIDRASHHLWGNLEAPELYPTHLRPTDEQRAAGAEALFTYYAYTDALIGLLTEPYGPDDLVLVVSDHGFEGGMNLGYLTGIHANDAARDGVLFGRGPGIPPGIDAEGTTINDVTPTILAWLGLPVGADMDGRPAPFLRREFETVATHDVGPVARAEAAPSGQEAEILEQMRALGYID